MSEPWNLRTEDLRQADSLPNFIIFCEDEVSEPIYFKYFETPTIKVNPIKNQKSKTDNVLKAICHCKDHGLMECKDGLFYLQGENTQVWCVFDRDIEDTAAKTQLGNTGFDESIKTAISNKFKVAWSNDSFELWILLHFEDVDLSNVNYKNRNTYYDRLTEIFKALPSPNEDLIKVLKYSNYSYKANLKSENNFRSIVRNEIVGKTNDAIKRAIVLEAHHNSSKIPDHEKSPCTLVHHLVEELLRLGSGK